jgi:hypothetical protein
VSRKILLLNLALLALAGVLVWQIRLHWRDTRAHERDVLLHSARLQQVLAPPPPPPLRTATPADYLDVAQHTLFSRDRNPNVIPDATPPPPPPPPMPGLPSYHGQMAFGPQPVVFLSLAPADQKGYHAGDEIGPFKLLSFDLENITFEWRGEPVQRTVAELKPKEVIALNQAAAPPVAPAPQAQGVISLSSVSGPAAATSNGPANPTLGTDMGGGFRACVAGDNTPAGTVLNGYRKVVARNLMGQSCHWEQIK